MVQRLSSVPRTILRAVVAAIRARAKVFVVVTLAVVVLNLLLPPVVLSVVRKPWDHFSMNPWLHNIPHWLVSDRASASKKFDFLRDVAIFWFVADSPYDAAEWGFTATVTDIARWILMGVLFGAYFALVSQVRGLSGRVRLSQGRLPGRGRFAGPLLTTLGFSTMPCSVTGCGAPVLPVVGLALTGLSSGALAAISVGSRVLVWLLLLGVAVNVIYLALITGDAAPTDPSMT